MKYRKHCGHGSKSEEYAARKKGALFPEPLREKILYVVFLQSVFPLKRHSSHIVGKCYTLVRMRLSAQYCTICSMLCTEPVIIHQGNSQSRRDHARFSYFHTFTRNVICCLQEQSKVRQIDSADVVSCWMMIMFPELVRLVPWFGISVTSLPHFSRPPQRRATWMRNLCCPILNSRHAVSCAIHLSSLLVHLCLLLSSTSCRSLEIFRY